MWYSLLFKVFFARKFIKIIFIFYFFKIIFDINTLKNIKTHKILIRNKKINLKKYIYIKIKISIIKQLNRGCTC